MRASPLESLLELLSLLHIRLSFRPTHRAHRLYPEAILDLIKIFCKYTNLASKVYYRCLLKSLNKKYIAFYETKKGAFYLLNFYV